MISFILYTSQYDHLTAFTSCYVVMEDCMYLCGDFVLTAEQYRWSTKEIYWYLEVFRISSSSHCCYYELKQIS